MVLHSQSRRSVVDIMKGLVCTVQGIRWASPTTGFTRAGISLSER